MLILSISDIMFSLFGPFLGTWVMPKTQKLYALGSEDTCIVAGFIATIGIVSTPLLNCSIVVFYLLKLKFSWVNRKIKAIEKLCLTFAVGLITAISSAAMKGIGVFGYTCA